MMVPVALVGSRCNFISFCIKLCVELCMTGMASRCNVIIFCIGLCVQLCMTGMTSRCNFISFRIELCVEKWGHDLEMDLLSLFVMDVVVVWQTTTGWRNAPA